MKMLTSHQRAYIIKLLKEEKELPEDFKYLLFPTIQKEYELVYAGKMRKEDLLANEDGVFPVPLQIEKVFNGNEYEAFEDGWKNMIVFGDNLQFLKTIYENKDPLIKDKVRGKVKLIYIDPPFATADEFQSKEGAKAYNDKKKGAEFVEFLRRRLILACEVLADDGSIYIHLDSKMSHYIKVLADEIFKKSNFRGNLTWEYQGSWVEPENNFPKRSQQIFYFTKSKDFTFNKLFENEKTEKGVIKRWAKYIDNGKIYGKNAPYDDGKFAPYLNNFIKENGREPQKNDVIAEFKGRRVGDVWYLSMLNPISSENMKYPTQKPEELLTRIIETSSNRGDIVMDFFGGSGTTMAAAEKLGRKWITCDLGKLAYYTMQKRILQIQDSRDFLANKKEKNIYNTCSECGNTKVLCSTKYIDSDKKYGKKAKNFVTASLGMYDLKKALNLEWQKYQEFVSSLFEVDIRKNKIAGFEFDGKKSGFPVKIFDYRTFKDSAINEDYLKEIHTVIGKKVSGRVYIIAPVNYVDFLSNYHEIDGVKYYFLKIPYYVIKELHKTPFQKLRQPQSKKNVNDLEEAVGFHFIRHPEVKSELTKDRNKARILIKSFVSHELESDKTQDEREMRNFETLSAVFVDKSYNGKAFEMDEAFFADELLPKKTKKENESDKDIKNELKKIEKKGLEITLKKSELGKQMMVIYTDIYGNDFTETFTV